MNYRIDYGPARPARFQKSICRSRLWRLTGGMLLVFFAATVLFWPDAVQALQQLIFPVTPRQLDILADALGQGAAPGEAAAAFCRAVLADAQLS